MTSRRRFLQHTSLFGASLLTAPLWSSRLFGAEADAWPVVETTYGKLRGMDVAGIKTFRGIHYGGDTGGAGRFMPPTAPARWTGVRDAFAYGPAAPQGPINPNDAYGQSVRWDQHVKTGVSEDCLVLNVWTPALNDGARRPVCFYIHGGGFNNGSGGIIFDGDPLARLGDVVVVTVNHRLGPIGYLDLGGATGDERFASASSAGMLDLVAALDWVRDNIATFGGDPGNVMIFGQSGGGAKVSTLQVMPAARGRFHKACMQSGSTIRLGDRDAAIERTERLLAELGIAKDNPAALQQVSWTAIIEAEANTRFGPVVDGEHIPRHPFDPDAPEISADVPILVGYTKEDAGLRNLRASELTEAGLRDWIYEAYPAKAAAILTAYRRVYPSATPFQVQSRIRTDANTRNRALTMVDRKAAQGRAPAYLYEMAWASPAFEGRFGATHGTDLGLVLGTARDPIAGNTPEARNLAHQVGSAIAAFARTGNPNCDAVPFWPAYTADSRATLVFDTESRVERDPTPTLRMLWE